MAKQWSPGMVVDIATANSGTLAAVVVGPATTGDTTQLRVRFPDGKEEDRDAAAFHSPRGQHTDAESGERSASPAVQQAEERARSDENEVRSTREPRQRTSSHEEVVKRQQQEEAEASMVTAELAAWLQKRDLMHRAHVIAASLEASGARKEEWVSQLDDLVSTRLRATARFSSPSLLHTNELFGWGHDSGERRPDNVQYIHAGG